ncbi:MAG: zinc ribbon domain-containing protein [Isosphaeraceae bacterium]
MSMRKASPSPSPLNDPSLLAVRTALRVAGPLMLLTGLALTVIGFVSFFSSFSSIATGEFTGPPRYFWCAFVGMPLLFLGVGTSAAGYLGAFGRYMASQTVPVQRDVVNELATGTAPAVRTFARAVGEGLRAPGESVGSDCPKCASAVPAGSRFCPGCGVPFEPCECPSCGAEGAPGARFCHACGAVMGTPEIA